MKDYYGWTFNVGINPVHIFYVNLWLGNRSWTWEARHPLNIRRVSPR